MVALPDLTARIRVDTSDLERAVGRASKQGSAIGSALGSAVGGLAAGGLSRAASGIAGFATGSVDAFARVEDATGAAGVQFGKALPTVVGFAEKAAAGFGVSKGAALDAANTFGTLGKAAGLQGAPLANFSTKFTGLAGDLASFKGTSTEQAIEAVGAALRGESEPIRAYGVLLDDASLRQEALSQGLVKTTKEALTPQQKVLATQALILKQTTDAQGDYARTSTSTANTQKTLAAETENAQAALGQKLAPATTALRQSFLGLVRGAGTLVDSIGRIADRVQPVVQAFASGLQPALTRVVPALRSLVAAIPQPVLQALAVVLGAIAAAIVVQTAATAAASIATAAWAAVTGPFVAVKNAEGAVIARGTVARLVHNVATVASTAATLAWSAATKVAAVSMRVLNAVLRANPIGLVITALTLLVGGLILAYRRSETFRAVVQKAFAAVKAAGAALGRFFTTTIPAAFAAVKARVGAIVNGLRAGLAAAWASIRGAAAAVFNGLKGFFVGVFNTYRSIVTRALAGIRSAFTGALSAIRGAVSGGLGRLAGIASGALATMRSAVSGGIGRVVGLVAAFPGRVVSGLGNIGGALSGAGAALMQGLADGVRAAGERVIAAARAVVQRVKDLLPGSPIKAGPLRSWNKGGAGKRLMGLLADGISSGGPQVQGALAGALAGLDVGELGAASRGRLGTVQASTPAAALPGSSRTFQTTVNLYGAEATPGAVVDELGWAVRVGAIA